TQLRRPLDFAAATDHAEFFGEFRVCTIPGHDGFDSDFCVRYREQIEVSQDADRLGEPGAPLPRVFFDIAAKLILPNPTRFPLCGTDDEDCIAETSMVWEDEQAAAEEFYDRCTFTTFAAYEWTGNPGGANIHRNVIFRNAVVPALPISYFEAPTPQQLWSALDSQRLSRSISTKGTPSAKSACSPTTKTVVLRRTRRWGFSSRLTQGCLCRHCRSRETDSRKASFKTRPSAPTLFSSA
ncbi:MAG: DUF3604 domain-containing protein, partial [Deltaproteobacteria bacterium]|nr:DUF3604 domain-containing protein [Deltaproteobacteria bacterium]